MFLRSTIRRKDGKEHRYWSIVENKRVVGGRVVQRHVLYWASSIPYRSWRGADRFRSSTPPIFKVKGLIARKNLR
jgi:hypothetical protein